MAIIILHPKTKEEVSIFEYLAKRLNTPYEITKDESTGLSKKPSDFFGSMSEEEGEKMHSYISKSREEWKRDN